MELAGGSGARALLSAGRLTCVVDGFARVKDEHLVRAKPAEAFGRKLSAHSLLS